MRLLSTVQCKEGMELGKTIYTDVGQVLLHEGVTLTAKMLARLQDLEIPYLYIKDERTADIVVEEILSDKVRTESLHTIRQEFSKIALGGKLEQVVESYDFGKKFRGVVRGILDDVLRHKKVMSVLVNVHNFDNYIFQHSLNVTVYTLALASSQNYNEKQMVEIGLGAILHDVGKLMVPYEILAKEGKLTDTEFTLVKEHAANGFEILRKVHDIPLLAAHCAYQHHERLDGSGYPRGITDEHIHPYAKIIAIADVFDALTSNRSYRRAMLPHMAMELIYSGAGTLFDVKLVEKFRNTISMYPIGATVQLNTGYKGVVVDHNQNLPSRPVVRLLEDDKGNEINGIEEIDLAKHLTVMIEDSGTML